MNNIFKKTLSQLLTLPAVGAVISKFVSNAKYYGVEISFQNPGLTKQNIAKIFWQLYESAEARLITRYLRQDMPVVELGASIGIISTLIGSKVRTHPIICVEPNQKLIESIVYNLNSIQKKNYNIENKAIAYSGNEVLYHINDKDNLVGHIARDAGVIVKSITLDEIVKKYHLDQYSLVMDIEGSELDIILHENEALTKCRQIICELHATTNERKHYSIDDLINLIEDIGYNLVARDGNCFVFEK